MAPATDTLPTVDYTIFSVVIMTLGLLLFVELLRSKLDKYSSSHHFYSTVLEHLWHELATLGMVEFGIFLLHEYYADFNIDYEIIFARVHFLLFYTALINVFLTVIVERATFHRSRAMWFKAEELDLNQYVLIRKGYIETREKLERVEPGFLNVFNKTPLQTIDISDGTEISIATNASKCGYLMIWVKLAYYHLRHPILVPRYERLAEQRRFHELRIHFIASNSLPIDYPIAKYLLRSQNAVFEDLVHISSVAWISFMVLVESLYFSFGVLVYIYKNTDFTDTFLISLIIFMCMVSIICSYAIDNKMAIINGHMVHNTSSIGAKVPKAVAKKDTDEAAETIRRKTGARFKNIQQGLFWFSRPSLIINIFQIIQFGYAIMISSLLIFENYTEKMKNFKVYQLYFIVIISYAIFVRMISLVIPKYTQCTSLGQMARESFMYEILASLHLKQAKKKKIKTAEVKEEEGKLDNVSKRNLRRSKSLEEKQRLEKIHTLEFLTFDEVLKRKDEFDLNLSQHRQQRRSRTRERGSFQKSLSSGVQQMVSMITNSDTHNPDDNKLHETNSSQVADDSHPEPPRGRSRRAHKRTKSLSAPMVIADMAAMTQMEDTNTKHSVKNGGVHSISKTPLQLEKVIEDIPVRAVAAAELKVNARPDELDFKEINNDVGGGPEEEEEEKHFSFQSALINAKLSLKSYLVSPAYRFNSFFFGTIVAFFWVGMRIEVLLIKSKVLYDSKNTFHFRHGASFWTLIIWFSFFLLDSLMNSILLYNTTRIFASLFDAVITSLCLCFLILSEIMRTGDGPFGSKAYDGGSSMVFDMLTALIVLREFRFKFAKALGKRFNKRALKIKEYQLKLKGETLEESHEKHDLHTHEATITLWKRTVENHHKIVKTHGEFSSQVLQLMLGLGIDEMIEGNKFSNETEPQSEKASYVFRASTMDKFVFDDSETVLRHGESACLYNIDSAVIQVQYPQSHLIAPMHRGELKLEGYSDWHVVDIIITRHELICLECFDDEGRDIAALDLEEEMRPTQNLTGDELRKFNLRRKNRAKLLASSGGQGLLLGDVVAGRSVISHLELDDVDSVKVERHVFIESPPSNPTAAQPLTELQLSHTQISHSHAHIRSEYWRSVSRPLPVDSPLNKDTSITQELNTCFNSHESDQLVISSRQGLMYIRFIHDLELAERALGGLIAEASENTIALDWCGKIVRYSKKQKEEPGADISSYLNIVEEDYGNAITHSKKRGMVRSKSMRRIQSFIHLEGVGGGGNRRKTTSLDKYKMSNQQQHDRASSISGSNSELGSIDEHPHF